MNTLYTSILYDDIYRHSFVFCISYILAYMHLSLVPEDGTVEVPKYIEVLLNANICSNWCSNLFSLCLTKQGLFSTTSLPNSHIRLNTIDIGLGLKYEKFPNLLTIRRTVASSNCIHLEEAMLLLIFSKYVIRAVKIQRNS